MYTPPNKPTIVHITGELQMLDAGITPLLLTLITECLEKTKLMDVLNMQSKKLSTML